MKIIFISDMLIFFKFNDEFQNLNVVQEIEKFEFKSMLGKVKYALHVKS